MSVRVGLLESDDLGVVALVILVCAFAEQHFVTDEDATNLRVRRGEPGGGCGEVESAVHERFVLGGGHGRHAPRIASGQTAGKVNAAHAMRASSTR